MTSYLFALVDAGGTVPPELGAVRRLVERGHSVEVFAEESMRAEVAATGATFHSWTGSVNRPDRRPENDPLQDWSVRTPRELISRMLRAILIGPAAEFAGDVTSRIRQHRPDVVVCSFLAVGAMVAAEAAGLPYFVLMANIYVLPAPGMPPLGLGVRPATALVTRVRDGVVNSMVRREWNRGRRQLNTLRKQQGLRSIRDFWDQVRRADKVLVMTSRHFDFPAELPSSVRYVGPVLDDPEWAVDDSWTPPVGEGPLVLVAMSSTFQDQVGVLQSCIDALDRLPVRGIVTTGLAVGPTQLRAAPGVDIVTSAPHSRVLEHAAAVLTHGGHGTVMRALAAGVPMVVVPQGRDQNDNAVRVAARGAGLVVAKDAGSAAIADALRRMLDDESYREAAVRLGERIRSDVAAGSLVAELEDIRAIRRTDA